VLVKFKMIFADVTAPVKVDPGDHSVRLTFDTDGGEYAEVNKLIAFGGNKVLEASIDIPGIPD
jgi:outer membrane translocation and assembly module TamA